jgi:Tol biopolymer transport system component
MIPSRLRLTGLLAVACLMVPATPWAQNRASRQASPGTTRAPLPVAMVYETANRLLYVDAGTTAAVRTGPARGTLSDGALSPDGKTVAGTLIPSAEGSDRLIVTMAPGKTESPRNLAQPGTNNYGPLWSPDGSRMAYNHFDPEGSTYKIVVSSSEGEDPAIISGKVEGQEDMVFLGWWEANGKSLWFYDFKFAYCVDLDGSERKRIPIARLLGDAVASSGIRFSPSPDGKSVLIGGFVDEGTDIKNEDGGANLIFLHDFESAKTRRISPKGMLAGSPQWLPDGESFVFDGSTKSSGHNGIYRMSLGDSKAELIATPGSQPSLALHPAGDD